MSENPVLVEVFRGRLVESRHRASVAVVDADGGVVLALGDVARPVYPRSAAKIVQALALVESGAADAYGFDTAMLALAGASHSGEKRHVAAAAAMLAAAGRGEPDLGCGVSWPDRRSDVAEILLAGGSPSQLHHNCSGKHSGFVCLACHQGIDPAGYTAPDHPVQREVKGTLENVFGYSLSDDAGGIDGCSVPTWAVPIDRMAHGMARLATGQGLAPIRAAAARRLMDAAIAEPFMVAGTGRFCTDFMTALSGQVYAKTGAEGVYCAAIPALGIGIAVKCDDGTTRASEVITARVVAELLGPDGAEATGPFLEPVLHNWKGTAVGRIATTEALARKNWA